MLAVRETKRSRPLLAGVLAVNQAA